MTRLLENIKQQYHKLGIPLDELKELEILSNENPNLFRRLSQRRLFNEPLAYLKGEVYFFGRKFNVDRRVYVPNPETEKMVRFALSELDVHSSILDVGTGSGSIAITLKKENPRIDVFGCDISPSALEVATKNALDHRVSLSFFESCYVDDLDIDEPTHIISDLPYGDERYILPSINLREFRHMPPESCFHPLGSLYAYKELIESIKNKGWKPKLFFESGKVKKDEVAEIIPQGMDWRYVLFEDNYSVTRLDFNQ